MKFDIVRTWKELSDAELESVYACGGSPLLAPIPVAEVAASDATSTHIHSYAVLCDVSVFSAVVNVIPVLNIANPTSQTCASDH